MHYLLLSFILLISPVAPRKLMADKSASSVTYSMKHPLHAWDAVSREVNCAATYNDDTKQLESVAAVIKLSTFDSRDANRDSHGLEIMEAIKYPTVSFASQRIVTNADGSLTATGRLTFHGVTRPVTIQAAQRTDGGRLTVTGSFSYSLTEFNLERPSLLGLKTEDDVKMKFAVVFKL